MGNGIRPRRTLPVAPVAFPDVVRKTPAALARAREAEEHEATERERERQGAELIADLMRRKRDATEDELFGIVAEPTAVDFPIVAATLENTTSLDTRIVTGGGRGGGKTWLSEQIVATRRKREELGRRLASEAGITNDADALRALRAEATEAMERVETERERRAAEAEERQRRELLGALKVEVFAQAAQVVAINGVEYRIPGGRSMVPKPFADLYRQSFRERAAPISYRADSKMGWGRL